MYMCLPVFSFLFFFFLMIRRPPRSTRTDTLFPYTTLFRSALSTCAAWNIISATPITIAMLVFFHKFKRSEEHTSELQSLMRISYAVFCLKKKKRNTEIYLNKSERLDQNNQPQPYDTRLLITAYETTRLYT